MRKIIIKVPQSNEKWLVSFSNTPSRRKDATTIFRLIERRLLRTAIKDKTSILVKYDKDTTNESLDSTDARYLLYTLSCFLEDYLTKEYLKKLYKQYG